MDGIEKYQSKVHKERQTYERSYRHALQRAMQDFHASTAMYKQHMYTGRLMMDGRDEQYATFQRDFQKLQAERQAQLKRLVDDFEAMQARLQQQVDAVERANDAVRARVHTYSGDFADFRMHLDVMVRAGVCQGPPRHPRHVSQRAAAPRPRRPERPLLDRAVGWVGPMDKAGHN